MSDREAASSPERGVLAVFVLIGVCYVYSNIVMAPLLLQLSAHFQITLGTAGLTTAVFALAGSAVPLLAGPYSDRYGRKRFLVSGTALLGLGMLAAAVAPSFDLLIAFRAVAGVGGALCASSLVASVADAFPYRERGRSIAILSTANAGVTMIGIPVAGILAEAASWRVSMGLVGATAAGAAVLVAARLPSSRSSDSGITLRELYGHIFGSRSALLLLGVGTLHVAATVMWATYVVVFLQTMFALPQGLASTVALTGGVGFLLGSQSAGRWGDRAGHRGALAVGFVIGALGLVAITGTPVGLAGALAVNVVLGAAFGARAVSHSALLTEQLPGARATLMAVYGSMSSIAGAFGAMTGGVLIDAAGSWLLLGLTGAVMFLMGVALLVPVAEPREAAQPAA